MTKTFTNENSLCPYVFLVGSSHRNDISVLYTLSFFYNVPVHTVQYMCESERGLQNNGHNTKFAFRLFFYLLSTHPAAYSCTIHIDITHIQENSSINKSLSNELIDSQIIFLKNNMAYVVTK